MDYAVNNTTTKGSHIMEYDIQLGGPECLEIPTRG